MEDFWLRFVSFCGLFVFVLCAWLLSSNRAKFDWRIVIGAIGMQFIFAVAIFATRNLTFPDKEGNPRFENGVIFYGVESFFKKIEDFTDQGRKFVFNVNPPPKDETVKARVIKDKEDAKQAAANDQGLSLIHI